MIRRGVEARLVELERELATGSLRGSADFVRSLLGDGFYEFGSSGRVYDRAATIAALSEGTSSQVELAEFKALWLSDDVVLLTYKAERLNESGASTSSSLRSSLWQCEGKQWRLVFHQGTMIS